MTYCSLLGVGVRGGGSGGGGEQVLHGKVKSVGFYPQSIFKHF